MFQIRTVTTQSEWSDFIDLPWTIYKNYPNWVPPLKIAVRDTLNVNKNPFFKHATLRLWVVYQNGQCVGRVAGVIDDRHNEYHQEKVVFFGFFESIDHQDVVNLLMDEVVKWGKSKGMDRLRGPVNPSTNHECGLLVEGFDDTPFVMMTYNPAYYVERLENWGLTKAKDLFAYLIDGKKKFSDRIVSQAERLKSRGSVTFRALRMNDFDNELKRIHEIYNDAWEKNWGFVPMNPEEFRHLAKDMKLIVDPRICLIAEVRGEVAGFALALPDVNQAIRKVKKGQLIPTGLLSLLWNIKGPGKRKTINRARIITLGIKRDFREAGIGPILYTEYLKLLPALGYQAAEASWILEDNKPMNKALQLMCGDRSRVYRLYDRALA